MKLRELIAAQDCGALKVEHVGGMVTVGNVKMDQNTCKEFAGILGWTDYDKQAWEVIDKTNKFIRSIKNHIDNDKVLSLTDVAFENRRKQNTEKHFDRIKMVNPFFQITILYGMPGAGGTYAVYSGENNFCKAVFSCRTAKQIGDYINTLA